MKLFYFLNVLVAGWISITSLWFPESAHSSVFEECFVYSETIRLVSALWFAIFILSLLGIFFPQKMCVVLLFQLIYKGSWLLFSALPAALSNQMHPRGMTIFFCFGSLDCRLLFLGSFSLKVRSEQAQRNGALVFNF